MYYVYILKSEHDGSHYVGSTENVENRMADHNAGSVRSTKSKRPWKLVWYCAFRDKGKALKFEKYLKHGSGHAFARKRLVSEE